MSTRLKRIDGEHYYLPGTDLEIMQAIPPRDFWEVRLGDCALVHTCSTRAEARTWAIEHASEYPEVIED